MKPVRVRSDNWTVSKQVDQDGSRAKLRLGTLCALLGLTVGVLGCEQRARQRQAQPSLQPVSQQDRQKRRAFDGAPPVVPHQAFGVACVTCHTETGKEIPTVGIASANPHLGSQQQGAFANCKQCHLFANSSAQFVDNSFRGLTHAVESAERTHPGAPPVTPHSVAMRSNCLACHTGVAARPEIRCTHPERTNCRQCHLTVDATAQVVQFPVP